MAGVRGGVVSPFLLSRYLSPIESGGDRVAFAAGELSTRDANGDVAFFDGEESGRGDSLRGEAGAGVVMDVAYGIVSYLGSTAGCAAAGTGGGTEERRWRVRPKRGRFAIAKKMEIENRIKRYIEKAYVLPIYL